MSKEELPLQLLKNWMKAFFKVMGESVDEKTREKILEECGKACASYHGHIDKVLNMKKEGKNLDRILKIMNQDEMWCGEWVREGDIISTECKRCECPLILSGILELSPTFCLCSRGFVKYLFEVIMDKPVRIELKRAIGRGDDVCEFIVQ